MKPFEYGLFGDLGETLKAGARRLDRALAAGLRPPERMSVARWPVFAPRKFPDGHPYEGDWSDDTAPELVEIQELLSPHDPTEEVDVIKCAQSGGSAAAENLVGYTADLSPGPVMYVAPTLGAATDWATEKLWPMIEATPRLNPAKGGAILAQTDGGSSKFRIKFRKGGYLLLSGANSAASLRGHTVRVAIEDDVDEFPDDLSGQGSPEGMVDARLKVYRRQGLSKRLKISTPRIKGASKIGAAYAASDRRRFYFKCVCCGARFDPIWEPTQDGQRDIHWPEGQPEEAYLTAPCCGGRIEHWQKAAMKLVDGWLSIHPAGGERAPRHMSEEDFQKLRAAKPKAKRVGFHIGGIISTFQTWADMAEGFVAAIGNANKFKTWVNLTLGDEYEVRGDAPDHEQLAKLIEQHFGRGRRLPTGPLAVTMGVDVQGDGLYYVIIAWGEAAEMWIVEANFIPGQTDVAGAEAWADLDTIARRSVVFPGGREYGIDQICVDAGYHTAAAEGFCKGHADRLPVFGRAGWTLPILGRGENLRYETDGKNAGKASKRAEDKAYLVGTYGVKATWYGYLRQTLAAFLAEVEGRVATIVRGRIHFGQDLPADFFEQITSEMIETQHVNGYPRKVWVKLPSRENHYLDCVVYNFAAAERLKLDTLTEAEWVALRAERTAEVVVAQADLFDAGLKPALPAAAQPDPPPETANAVRTPGYDWSDIDGGWLNGD